MKMNDGWPFRMTWEIPLSIQRKTGHGGQTIHDIRETGDPRQRITSAVIGTGHDCRPIPSLYPVCAGGEEVYATLTATLLPAFVHPFETASGRQALPADVSVSKPGMWLLYPSRLTIDELRGRFEDLKLER